MQKYLPALALSFAAQIAMADNLPARHDPQAPAAGGLMHASLVVPAQPGGGPASDADPSALNGGLSAGAQTSAKKAGNGRDHTTGMLLAALALMAGIVLRRWGNDRQ